MTICISAIATQDTIGNKEEHIVFATDHMISVGDLGQFEKEIKKYKQIKKGTIAMLSGNSLIFDKALEGTSSLSNFTEIRNKIHSNIVNIRKEIIKREVHDLFGIDENYIKNILPNPIQNIFVQNILQITADFSLKTNILLIGFDAKGEAQISEINEKGHSDYRDLHFHAIGSGSIQALNTLLFQNHAKKYDLKMSIYNVYKAKRNAEVANGVGRETEILLLKNNSDLVALDQRQLNILDNIYNKELKFGALHTDLNSLFT